MKSIREIITLLEHGEDLPPKVDSPEVKYEYGAKTKKAITAKEFTTVTAHLSGKNSEVITRIGNKFREINELEKRIKVLRDETNDGSKDKFAALFHEEDKYLTRYMDTVSVSITMAKDTADQMKQSSRFDTPAFLDGLYELLSEDLHPAIKKLVEVHTKISTVPVAGRKGAIKITPKESDQFFKQA